MPPLPLPQVRTLAYSLYKVKARFGKSDPELEASIVNEVTDRLREICADYPYWFLSVEPGGIAFPFDPAPSNPATHNWFERGWFVTTVGVESYPLYVQVDLSDDCTMMAPSEAKCMNWVKRFSLQGAMEADLRIVHSDAYLSWGNNQGGANTGMLKGAPYMAFPYTRNRATYLRLNPIPDKQYIIAASWQLAWPPWFAYGDCVTNLIMEYYPRVIECLIGLQYADFFKETEELAYYHNELYGDEMGSIRPGLKNIGLVGTMRKDTIMRYSQETGEVEWFPSSRAAVGRGGAFRRQPSDTYYISPSEYGA